MERTPIGRLPERAGERVRLCGWVTTLRLQRAMQFVVLRDATGSVQLTHARGGEGDALEAALDGLTPESAVVVEGEVRANARVKLGGIELAPTRIEVVARAETPLPLDDGSGAEVKLDWRFLDVRRDPRARLALEVQSAVEQAMRAFAHAEGCLELHTPKLMGTASESGAEVFRVDYFGGDAYLAQSPQLYKQMAIAAGLERVFEIGPVFRAEPSYTSRHATEFTGVDVELAWIEDVEDVMAFEERMLAHVLATVAERLGDEIEECCGVAVTVPELPFPRIAMADALALLRAQGWDPEGAREDLDRAGEQLLGEHVLREHGHELAFLTRFPASVRPFYHMRDERHDGATRSFDLLWKGVEITTGAQREHRHDRLVAQAREHGLELEPLERYLDCFRFGTPSHGGFGLGLGRLLMSLLALDSIREATFLFRGPNRLAP
ncbi:MAG: aspartate--tRNA(Asn) ligase [Conexibacter sp.]